MKSYHSCLDFFRFLGASVPNALGTALCYIARSGAPPVSTGGKLIYCPYHLIEMTFPIFRSGALHTSVYRGLRSVLRLLDIPSKIHQKNKYIEKKDVWVRLGLAPDLLHV
jgi:hypothetical protein